MPVGHRCADQLVVDRVARPEDTAPDGLLTTGHDLDRLLLVVLDDGDDRAGNDRREHRVPLAPRPGTEVVHAPVLVVDLQDVGAACSEVALMSAGKIVFRGTPGELTARGVGYAVGDAPLERGYSAVLAEARS